jgi:hypothetical protein
LARIQKNKYGELQLIIYGDEAITIPADWLINILNKAKEDLK